MKEVGFGTGSLYRQNIPLEEILDFYKDAGATAVEISLGSIEEFERFKLTKKLIDKVNTFPFVSLHAPFRNIKYGPNNQTKKVLEKLDYINENLPLQGIVIHPDIIEDFTILQESGLPFLIENMNPEKESGKFPHEFEKYNQFNLGYVLDIEHVYGNDQTMQLAGKLMEIMGKRLGHLHVSGKTGSVNHTLCHSSKNKSVIEEILKNCPLPKISEGKLSSLDYDSASKEIEFLKQF